MYDFHIHTTFSPDGQSSAEEYCRRAEIIGCDGICITDHLDIDYPDRRFENREGVMLSAVQQERLREKGYNVFRGIEAGYAASAQQETARLLGGMKLDYVINSVHVVDGQDPYYPEFFENKSREGAYRRYLETVYESLDACYDYSVVGHLGYIYRHAPYPLQVMQWREFPDLYDAILMRVIYLGKGLEVNTSSLRTSGDTMACMSVLRRYKELGGEIITLGSDAHAVRRLCEGFEQTRQLLLSSGMKYLAIYRDMKPEMSYIK